MSDVTLRRESAAIIAARNTASERVVLRANETGTTGFKIVLRAAPKKEH